MLDFELWIFFKSFYSYCFVFQARKRTTNEMVAVKVVRIDPKDDIKAILQEIFTLRDCTHPNIVKYHGSYFKWVMKKKHRLKKWFRQWIIWEIHVYTYIYCNTLVIRWYIYECRRGRLIRSLKRNLILHLGYSVITSE